MPLFTQYVFIAFWVGIKVSTIPEKVPSVDILTPESVIPLPVLIITISPTFPEIAEDEKAEGEYPESTTWPALLNIERFPLTADGTVGITPELKVFKADCTVVFTEVRLPVKLLVSVIIEVAGKDVVAPAVTVPVKVDTLVFINT